MTKTWFLSGPMTGLPRFGYDTFEEATQNARAQGLQVVSPHELNWNADLTDTSEARRAEYLRKGLFGLLGCTGLLLLGGWERSAGARLELRVAQALGMEVRDAWTFREVTEATIMAILARYP